MGSTKGPLYGHPLMTRTQTNKKGLADWKKVGWSEVGKSGGNPRLQVLVRVPLYVRGVTPKAPFRAHN